MNDNLDGVGVGIPSLQREEAISTSEASDNVDLLAAALANPDSVDAAPTGTLEHLMSGAYPDLVFALASSRELSESVTAGRKSGRDTYERGPIDDYVAHLEFAVQSSQELPARYGRELEGVMGERRTTILRDLALEMRQVVENVAIAEGVLQAAMTASTVDWGGALKVVDALGDYRLRPEFLNIILDRLSRGARVTGPDLDTVRQLFAKLTPQNQGIWGAEKTPAGSEALMRQFEQCGAYLDGFCLRRDMAADSEMLQWAGNEDGLSPQQFIKLVNSRGVTVFGDMEHKGAGLPWLFEKIADVAANDGDNVALLVAEMAEKAVELGADPDQVERLRLMGLGLVRYQLESQYADLKGQVGFASKLAEATAKVLCIGSTQSDKSVEVDPVSAKPGRLDYIQRIVQDMLGSGEQAGDWARWLREDVGYKDPRPTNG